MTITDQTLRVEANGDGVTIGFPFTMPVSAIDQIRVISTVISTGVETVEVEASTINTTLSGTPLGATGGTVTFVTPPPSTVRVTIHLDPALTQETIFPLSGPFPSPAVEAALDKDTNISKRTRDIASRSITLPDGALSGSGSMDAKSNKIMNVTDGVDPQDAVTMAQLGTLEQLGAGGLSGSGDPNGVVLAPVGTIYRRTDGIENSIVYVKQTGIGVSTGWSALANFMQPARSVSAATSIAVIESDRVLFVTGATKVDNLTGGTFGQIVTLIWFVLATFNVDGTGSGIELNGGSDITTATANSTLTLYFNGTNWLEFGRSIT